MPIISIAMVPILTTTIRLLLSIWAIHAWRGALVAQEHQMEEEYLIARGLRKVQKVAENVYVQPGIPFFVSPIWYKYDGGAWFWTPFGPSVVVSPRWIPVSETKLPKVNVAIDGHDLVIIAGATPVSFNCKIIRYLDEHNPDPATEFQLV